MHINLHFDNHFGAFELWKITIISSAYAVIFKILNYTVIGYIFTVIINGVAYILVRKGILDSRFAPSFTLWGRLSSGLIIGTIAVKIFHLPVYYIYLLFGLHPFNQLSPI